MRRAATYLTSIALLCLLSPFAMATAGSKQMYRSGVQFVPLNNHLPQGTILASPRSAAPSLEFFPAATEHTFFSEFYSYDMSGATTSSVAASAAKRSLWAEQRARLSPLADAAKKLVFNFLRR